VSATSDLNHASAPTTWYWWIQLAGQRSWRGAPRREWSQSFRRGATQSMDADQPTESINIRLLEH